MINQGLQVQNRTLTGLIMQWHSLKDLNVTCDNKYAANYCAQRSNKLIGKSLYFNSVLDFFLLKSSVLRHFRMIGGAGVIGILKLSLCGCKIVFHKPMGSIFNKQDLWTMWNFPEGCVWFLPQPVNMHCQSFCSHFWQGFAGRRGYYQRVHSAIARFRGSQYF